MERYTSRSRRLRALIVAGALAVTTMLTAIQPAPASADTAPTTTISGHVSLGTSGVAAGAGEVTVEYSTQWVDMPWSIQATTDASGNYTITGVPAGSQGPLFFQYNGSGAFSSELWQNKISTTAADFVSASSSGVDMTLPANAAITGVVTLGTGGAPAGAGQVTVSYSRAAWVGYTLGPESNPVPTAADGSYSLPGLAAGSYRLDFHFIGQGYEDRSVGVDFMAGADVTNNVALFPQQTLSGHVYLGSTAKSAGAGDIDISYTYSATGATWGAPVESGVTTDAAGDFAIPFMHLGEYQLTFTDTADPTYLPTTGNASLYNGQTPHPVSVTMTESVTISGNVSFNDESNANPRPAHAGEVLVTLVRSNPYGGLLYSGPDPTAPPAVATDASGNFSIPFVVTQGNWYTLLFHYTGSDPAYHDAYWGGSRMPAGAQPIAKAGAVVPFLDFAFAYPNQIGGHVADDHGQPVVGAKATVTERNATGNVVQQISGTSDSSGNYVISDIPAAAYDVDIAAPPTSTVNGSSLPLSAFHTTSRVTVGGTGLVRVDATLTPPVTARVSGSDRYSTGVAVAEQAFPSGAPIVFIASGASFADALSAGPAAAHLGGPILLTDPNQLPQVVAAEIGHLKPKRIIVVGGTGAVSGPVFLALRHLAPVERWAGWDRYETSRIIDTKAFSAGASTAFVATGATYPDALSAGAVAAAQGVPILLVDGQSQYGSGYADAALEALGVTSIVVAGGTGAVSLKVFADLSNVTPDLVRVSGGDRYATARALDEAFFNTDGSNPAEPYASTVFLTTGLNYPDALSAGPWAGSTGSALFEVPTGCVPPATLDDILGLGATNVQLVGGTGVLNEGVADLVPCY
ncbi:cell wall-binding repeat-containing protein [Diaminobutyricibacter sp. McL0618]|uniref:cell wall-binding repeat-containing protein n=1 Tax=Leifsonia sp. McL0618 TaxID=3415677 RepID=UPI003CF1E0EB